MMPHCIECYFIYLGCDPHCAGSCAKFGATKCDSTCAIHFGITSTNICAREYIAAEYTTNAASLLKHA